MYNKSMLYTFLGEIRDIVWRDLKESNNKFVYLNKKVGFLMDRLSGISDEIDTVVTELEEAHVERANIFEEAMYLKGFEDGFALVALMSEGCTIKKYSEFTDDDSYPKMS